MPCQFPVTKITNQCKSESIEHITFTCSSFRKPHSYRVLTRTKQSFGGLHSSVDSTESLAFQIPQDCRVPQIKVICHSKQIWIDGVVPRLPADSEISGTFFTSHSPIQEQGSSFHFLLMSPFKSNSNCFQQAFLHCSSTNNYVINISLVF